MPLPDLERRILELSGSLNLRPTLETAAQLGDLLAEAKSELPHGQWLGWLKRVSIHARNAQLYMQVRNANLDSHLPDNLTMKRFLAIIRDARKAERDAVKAATRAEMAAKTGSLPDGIRLEHADSRAFEWPERVDHVVTDPPWAEMEAYRWLAGFAQERLRTGGLILVQVGTSRLADVIGILSSSDLSYVWLLEMVYSQTSTARPFGKWSPGHRPILVYSKGKPDLIRLTTDTFTVKAGTGSKGAHDWGQPFEPWKHWIERVTRPGEMIADPFSGGGTIDVACQETRRKFVGTEKDEMAYKVAMGRIKVSDEQSEKEDGKRTINRES